MNNRPDAVGYRRISSDEKHQKSLESQGEICEGIAAKLGLRLVAVFQDEKPRGVARTGLQELLAFVEANPTVRAIVFWHHTRVWGTQTQYRRIVSRAQASGVQLVDENLKDWVPTNSQAKFVDGILAGSSEYETDVFAERTYSIQHAKAQKGKNLSRPPFGFQVVRTVDDAGEVHTKFVTCDGELAIVDQMFRRFVEDGWSLYHLAQWLTDSGVTTKTGKSLWTVHKLRQTLSNQLYVGKRVWNRRKTVWVEDPATGDKIKHMIERPENDWVVAPSGLGVVIGDTPTHGLQLFQEAQKLLEARRREHTRSRKYEQRVLDGAVFCGRCKQRMHIRPRYIHRNGHWEYRGQFDFHCPARASNAKACARSHQMSESRLLAALELAATAEAARAEGQVEFTLAPDPGLSRELVRVRSALAATDEQWRRAREAHRRGLYSDEDLLEEKTKIAAERERLEALVTDVESRLGDDDGPTLAAGEARKVLAELLPRLTDKRAPLEARRAVALRHLRLEVDHPNVKVVWAANGETYAA